MKNIPKLLCGISLSILLIMLVSSCNKKPDINNNHYIHIAKIIVDSTQLENYKVAVKEQAENAINKEPGVLTLYAVYDHKQPTHVTVFEIYASMSAYQSHIKTPHFLKYKSTVKNMVKSLVLTDVAPIALETKQE